MLHTRLTSPGESHDRKLNTILFRAAWGALSQVLGVDEHELAAIFTVQTAGEALNYHPHLHGLLADGYWRDGIFTKFAEVDLKPIEEAFAERVLAQLYKQELITDDDVAQILSQDHSGFGVWMGDPFHDKESEKFVARYIERAPKDHLLSHRAVPRQVNPLSFRLRGSYVRPLRAPSGACCKPPPTLGYARISKQSEVTFSPPGVDPERQVGYKQVTVRRA